MTGARRFVAVDVVDADRDGYGFTPTAGDVVILSHAIVRVPWSSGPVEVGEVTIVDVEHDTALWGVELPPSADEHEHADELAAWCGFGRN